MKYFAISAFLCSFLIFTACSEDKFLNEENTPLTITLQMPGKQETAIRHRIGLRTTGQSKDLIAEWNDNDQVQAILRRGNVKYDLGRARVTNISEDKRTATVNFDRRATPNIEPPYSIYLFSGNDHLASADMIGGGAWAAYCTYDMQRDVAGYFHAPLFCQLDVKQENQLPAAQFQHFGTYELLHVYNATNLPLTFVHQGFESETPWYQASTTVWFYDDYDLSPHGEWEGDSESHLMVILPGTENIVYSWYIPSGFPIKEARLIAKVNEEYGVKSSNTFTSSVLPQRGHAYHMYATWDGAELKFEKHAADIDGETTDVQYEAAKAAIAENGKYKIFTQYNGSSEGAKKYFLTENGYLTDDESQAHAFTFGRVSGSNLFASPGWKLDIPFSNPLLTNGATGDLPLHGHIRTDYRNGFRDNWEGQVWYKRGDHYAVRSTNAVSSEWGANTYWCVLDSDADGLPEADYSLTPKFVWQLEQYVEHLKLSADAITIRVGTSGYIDIISGIGPFTLINEKPSAVDCGLEERRIKVLGLTSGPCVLQVKDESTGEIQTVNINVVGNAIAQKQTFTVHGVTFNMIKVEGGTFIMGATSEQEGYATSAEYPAHKVTLSTYYISETEVTQALWEAVMGSNPSGHIGSDLPVENMTWEECNEFINKLNETPGCDFNLPTEAQWEFAARGGIYSFGYIYSGSNNIDDVAWYVGNSGGYTHPVATKSPNELGLYDMSGNVFEYVRDRYNNYSGLDLYNPSYPEGGDIIDRGGSYTYSDWNGACRVSWRDGSQPTRATDVGFRLVF